MDILANQTMEKRSFLLWNARTFPLKERLQHYDERQQLSVVPVRGTLVPIAALERAAHTTSKTEQAPGDDDPDPDAIECY